MAKIIPGKFGTKRELITQKAAHLFKEKGFSATSMRDLAEAIGVEAPSLYNHIGSKSDILREICFRIAEDFNNNLQAIEEEKGSSIRKIETLIRFHISMMIEEYESVYLSDHEWKHLVEPYLTDFKEQRNAYRKRFAAIIQKGIDKKEIKSMDPHIVVLTILSAIGGIESWQRSRKTISPKDLEENMVNILISGIKYHTDLHII